MNVREVDPPEGSMLQRYRTLGAYIDGYSTEVAGSPPFADFVTAFYTTPLFRIERVLLGAFAGRRSTDAEARSLADGTRDSFAAWHVESRHDDELLLADFTGRTRSWFKVEWREGSSTRLLFGSALLPGPRAGAQPWPLLLALHRRYSRLLLATARRRLLRS